MNKRLRYIVLFLCVAVFFIIAPLLILFVRGVTYNTENDRLDRTGIIAVATDPNDAAIFVDGKEVSTTPASIRFLPPRDYEVRIHKDGYFDWTKKLTVLDGKVTWVNPNPNKLMLLKNNSTPQNIVAGAIDFELTSSNTLIYATETTIVLLSGKDFTNTRTIIAPEKIYSFLPGPEGKYILVKGEKNTFILDTETSKLTVVTSKISLTSTVAFLDSSTLIALDQSNLFQLSVPSLVTTTLTTNISSFSLIDKELYALQRGSTTSTLLYKTFSSSQTPLEPLLTALPLFSKDQIFVSTDKRIFLWGDSTLYRINEKLEPLANSVTGASLDRSANALVFTTPGELSYYNFEENKIKLISRSGQPFHNSILRRDLNYTFFYQGNTLTAIELDDRDHQNTYHIYEANEPKKFEFSNDGATIIVLDSKGISTVTIK